MISLWIEVPDVGLCTEKCSEFSWKSFPCLRTSHNHEWNFTVTLWGNRP